MSQEGEFVRFRALAGTFLVAWAACIGLSAAGPPGSGAQGARAPVAKAQGPAGSSPQAGVSVGDDTCISCHEGEGRGFQGTLHGKARNPRAPAANTNQACETCHGPGGEHAEDGDETKIRRFDAMPAREVSDTCLTCHDRGVHVNWKGSPHDSRSISCVTCHSIHSPKSAKAQLAKGNEIETCATCHRAQAMKVNRTQHMPLREGKMTCTSCHNPHGSTNVKQLKVGHWVNESCVSCHTEKRGPFLWEHAAGRESCVTCHDPHGASSDKMLAAKRPFLCQRCHIGTRHPSTIYDGRNVVPGGTPSNRIYGRACVNCHSNIHGSNHPSGNAFLR